MKLRLLFLALLATGVSRAKTSATPELKPPRVADNPQTFCNPLDLDYRLQPDNPLRREAADPVCVFFKGDYYLFASKSGGYWWSHDFSHWNFVTPQGVNLEGYAPAVFEFDGELVYKVSGDNRVWKSATPKEANSWKAAGNTLRDTDPAFFRDDDGRAYLAYGCSSDKPCHIVEVNPKAGYATVGKSASTAAGDEKIRGWEVPGNHNDPNDPAANNRADPMSIFSRTPWVEGSWLTKHDGVYHLQYSAPGTCFTTYGDGVHTAKSPLGPYTYAPHSPFSFKPTGFMTGAGHSCTFADARGDLWHIASGVVCVRHRYERRLTVSPLRFDSAGRIRADTFRADLPQFLPGKIPVAQRDANAGGNLAGWNLLSCRKSVKASSESPDHPVSNATDENIRTWWSAATGEPGEWLEMDLGALKTVRAVQVNFAEDGMTARGRKTPIFQQYTLEYSNDGKTWAMLADKSASTKDAPHAYLELEAPLRTRHLRITNKAAASPALGKFALADLRVFGQAPGAPPRTPAAPRVERDANDRRHAVVSWDAVPGADGYVVSCGIAPDCLNLHFEVRGATTVEMRCLDIREGYHFTVRAFNESGTGKPGDLRQAP